MLEALIPALVLLIIGQAIHQIVRLKRIYQKWNSGFRWGKYFRENYGITLINMALIVLIGIANFYVMFLVGPLALLLGGFFIDNTISNLFKKPKSNGVK